LNFSDAGAASLLPPLNSDQFSARERLQLTRRRTRIASVGMSSFARTRMSFVRDFPLWLDFAALTASPGPAFTGSIYHYPSNAAAE
jgi:hypothetical protein